MLKHQRYPKRLALRIILLSLLAVPTTLAATTESAAASSGTVVKAPRLYSARYKAKRSGPAGVMFGGVTPMHTAVVIQVSRNGREIVQAAMTVPVQCSVSGQPSNPTQFLPAGFTHMPISRTGAFQKEEEGTGSEGGDTATVKQSVSGKFDRARTSVSGTWSVSLVVKDTTGATVAQCDSGAVPFTAIQ